MLATERPSDPNATVTQLHQNKAEEGAAAHLHLIYHSYVHNTIDVCHLNRAGNMTGSRDIYSFLASHKVARHTLPVESLKDFQCQKSERSTINASLGAFQCLQIAVSIWSLLSVLASISA